MSKAFTKEDDAPEPIVVAPRAALPAGLANYVTPRGLELLRAERLSLESERARAAALPDEAQRAALLSTCAARLRDLDQRLASAKLVTPEQGPVVRFGSQVTVEDAQGAQRRYAIVGADEADPASGRIAFFSPLARALLGKRAGEDVSFRSPGGLVELSVVSVE